MSLLKRKNEKRSNGTKWWINFKIRKKINRIFRNNQANFGRERKFEDWMGKQESNKKTNARYFYERKTINSWNWIGN